MFRLHKEFKYKIKNSTSKATPTTQSTPIKTKNYACSKKEVN